MELSRVELAARNNAIWCDTVCQLHDVPGEFSADAWVNRRRTPAYYPNLVTLREAADPGRVVERVRDLMAGNLSGSWAVKDSFQKLDLSAWGFTELFRAIWIWHSGLAASPVGHTSDIRWVRVSSPDELHKWEVSWSKAGPSAVIDISSRQFKPELLANTHARVFAGYRGQHLVAGGIANFSGDVMGLSNIFSPAGDESLVLAGLLQNARIVFPGIPIVGYEHATMLKAAVSVGFEKIGNLTVWLRHI